MATYDDIQSLTQREQVRIRPGMWVGNVQDNGFNDAVMNMVREVIGNSTDEFMNGNATNITILLDTKTNTLTIEDDGRGVPFSMNEKEGVSNLEVAASFPNSGAKYDKGEGQAFKFSIGLNGVGLKCVNFLSKTLEIESFRDSQIAYIKFETGLKVDDVTIKELKTNKSGTTVRFTPDDSIIPFEFNAADINRLCQEIAYLNGGLKVRFCAGGKDFLYHEPKGIVSYLEDITKNKRTSVNFPILKGTTPEGNTFKIAMKVMDSSAEAYYPYVNGNMIEVSSTPVVAIRQAFARAVSKYINEFAQLKKKDQKVDIQTGDIRSVIFALIKILHTDPAFDAQTKTKLINTDIAKFIGESVPDSILAFLLENPRRAAIIVRQALTQARARVAAAQARKKVIHREKKAFSDMNISLDQFTPPLSKEPWKNRLYLFEGLSASGSLTQAAKNKDANGELYKKHIGILALKGITLNCLELPIERAMKNSELATIVEVAGLNINDPDNLTGLNFNEFVIATDGDAGGDQICSLLTIFFLTYFPEVIRQGKLCRVITPLYEITDKKNRKHHFIYPDEDRERRVVELGFKPEDINKTYTQKRNKGLGEMSKKSNMTLVENPRFQYIKHENIEELKELFFVFSGKKKVSERKDLIFKLGLENDDA